MESQSLDQVVERPDLTQFLPIVGIGRAIYDHFKGRETIFDAESPSVFYGSAAVHGSALALVAYFLTNYLS
ncbi:hypothetical protein HYT55_01005 [Candidatus Woesearchaeota archaeon]|nr:hypothetical protein [Candidatus Woesearchaeota archaeon]